MEKYATWRGEPEARVESINVFSLDGAGAR
jgi:hypothetical protein